jgi:hypothetical protein
MSMQTCDVSPTVAGFAVLEWFYRGDVESHHGFCRERYSKGMAKINHIKTCWDGEVIINK